MADCQPGKVGREAPHLRAGSRAQLTPRREPRAAVSCGVSRVSATIAKFQKELGAMGYKFLFITLAGFHALNYGMFNLAHGYARRQMSAFVELQEAEFAASEKGFTAVKHQREVGTGYFDAVTQVIQQGKSSTTALT